MRPNAFTVLLSILAAAGTSAPSAAEAQPSAPAGLASMDPPAGWQRIARGDVTVYVPRGDAAVSLYVLPGEVVTAMSFDAWFEARWRDLGEDVGLVASGPVERAAIDGNDLRMRLGESGTGAWLMAVAAGRGFYFQPVLVVAGDEAAFARHKDPLFRATRSLRILPPADQGAPRAIPWGPVAIDGLQAMSGRPADQGVAPGAGATARVAGALEGLYIGMSVSPSYPGLATRSPERYVVFFPDGTFFERLPQEGLDGMDRRRLRAEYPADWGRYRVEGRRLLLRRDGGAQEMTGEVLPSGQLSTSGWGTLAPAPSVDGAVLDGMYARSFADPSSVPNPIAFRRDGTFEDAGVLNDLNLYFSGQVIGQQYPAGRGRYRVSSHTLVLSYADGRVVPLSLFAFAPAQAIFLGGQLLERRGGR